jgi:hypothetical protein
MRLLGAPAALTLAVAPAAPAAAAPSLAASGCPLFPADSVWHADVSRLPVHPRSRAYLAAMGTGAAIHADFGSGTWEGGPIGIPFTVVPPGQPKVPVRFGYAAESDPGPGLPGLLPQLLAGLLGLVAAALAARVARVALRPRRREPSGRHARTATPRTMADPGPGPPAEGARSTRPRR